jgi:signal transduction histidine kinase
MSSGLLMVSRPDLTIDQLKRRIEELESQLRGRNPSDEDRLADEQQARETAELLNRVGLVLVRELDQEKVIQSVTDIATKLVGAEFGSFVQYGGLPKDVFTGLPMPRNGTVRSGDITHDNPQSALRSYLAAPVVSRSGELLGGLFFGHSAPGRFTERHEALIGGVAGQAGVAIDNARLFEQARWVQNELKRANEDLRRANRDLETFSYSASHDLQEPLRNVALGAQLLQLNAGNKLDPEQTQFLDSILQGARRMEALVQALLTYTQAIRHADGPVPSVSAEKVLAEVVESLKYRIEECGAKVTAAPLPVLTIHEVHLTQLFQNLISNALKYRQPEAPSIHFSAIQEDGWTVLSVADNGIGLELKYADQIFSLFKRLHSRDDYPGSGIGLAICQRIVEQYGGRIWLEKSAPGAGSTFCISIPDRRTGP